MQTLPRAEGACAFFFDFDGTLSDLAERPEAVRVDPGVPLALARLRVRCEGALAVISGRPVAEIDQHLWPETLPAAGVHGAERRCADGRWQRLALPEVELALPELAAWCAARPGLRLERKPGALALHFRAAESLQPECLAAMQRAQRRVPGTVLLEGKMVVEMKPAAVDKGRALRAFMAEPPFAGRRPWFFGDDVTDEAAFDAVHALGGVAVKVGAGATRAPWRLADPAALRAWLERAAVGEALA